MQIGAAHWVFLSGIVLIIAVMIARRNVVIPAVAATFGTALAYDGDPVQALQAVFNASLTAATELFNIFLIIALVTALLGALRGLGADRRMVEPFRYVMRSGHSSYWVLAGMTYVISLFFWPTPAVPLIGGVVVVLLIAAALSRDGAGALESCADHIVDGLVFAVKAMGVVIPIAGFFFLGNADFAGKIMALGEGVKAPGFLFDLTAEIEGAIPDNGVIVGFAILLVGLLTGLDGSGFSGLPMTGALAGSLGPASGTDPALLAAIGQMGCIWAGGGVLIAWSSLLAVAGFARVPAMELVRRSFLPVVAGLVIATLAGIAIY